LIPLVCIAASETASASAAIAAPRINSVSSGGNLATAALPAEIVLVDGLSFGEHSQIHLQIDNVDLRVATRVSSQNHLEFVTPLGLPCGEHSIYLKDEDPLVLDADRAVSHFIPFQIRCLTGTTSRSATPADPWLESLQPLPVQIGAAIRITGSNFVFGSETTEMPKVLIDDWEVSSWWISDHQILLNSLPGNLACGDHKMQIVNVIEDYAGISDGPGFGFLPASTKEIRGNHLPFHVVCDKSLTSPLPAKKRSQNLTSLTEIDSDGNCLLSDPEFLQAIDFWVSGQLTTELFLQAVDAWIHQSILCSDKAHSASLLFRSSRSTIPHHLNLRDEQEKNIVERVDIYSLNGDRIPTPISRGATQNMVLQEIEKGLPNGVYFCHFTLQKADGSSVSEWMKIAVLR
jgi:hypothetical protein